YQDLQPERPAPPRSTSVDPSAHTSRTKTTGTTTTDSATFSSGESTAVSVTLPTGAVADSAPLKVNRRQSVH
ncbi:MAG: hypothetical protein K2M55_07025, partial [Muribaculaceae bacterium]|nr:hypothetical protein [Muribaculaceae bacterium]